MSEELWHYERDGRPIGPFSFADVERLAAAGIIGSETVLRDPEGALVSLNQVLSTVREPSPVTLGTTFPSENSPLVSPIPPPPPLPPQAGVPGIEPIPASRRPWNPWALCGFGVLFSPVWMGVMTALNAGRLGIAAPVWRPVAIGFGSWIVAELVSIVWIDSYGLNLLLYLGGLVVIWETDLKHQREPYLRRATPGPGASWLVPGLAGVPAAFAVLVVFVVLPLIPPTPSEVCRTFLEAPSTKDAKALTTGNLWPALEALAASVSEGGTEESSYEILGEETAPAEVGGHLVAYRALTKSGSQTETVEGIFQLFERDGRWKIEEIVYTSVNGQTLAEPVRLSQSYRDIASNSGHGRSAAAQAPTRTADKHDGFPSVSTALKYPGVVVALGKLLTAGGAKIGMALLALLGLGALGKKRK